MSSHYRKSFANEKAKQEEEKTYGKDKIRTKKHDMVVLL